MMSRPSPRFCASSPDPLRRGSRLAGAVAQALVHTLVLGAAAALACGPDHVEGESASLGLETTTTGESSTAGETTTTGDATTTTTAGSATSEDPTGDELCGIPSTLSFVSPGTTATNPLWLAVDAGPGVVRVAYQAEGVFPLGESSDPSDDFGIEVSLMTLGPRTLTATAFDACAQAVATASQVTVVREEQEDEGEGELGDPVCYPGPERAWDQCYPLALPGGAVPAYPPPLDNNPNYRAPQAYIDLKGVGLGDYLAPNFQFSEVVRPEHGDFVVVQPHAIARLQALRDALGSIQVTSGYRNPNHNASVGGTTWSRHMYGDAFDLYPGEASLEALFERCAAEDAGYRQLYANHVHCDWRADPVDPRFYGAPGADGGSPPPEALPLAATIVADGDGWLAPASGWDEGEPLRRWRAYDAEGQLLEEARGVRFVAPLGTARVAVTVGGVIDLEAKLAP